MRTRLLFLFALLFSSSLFVPLSSSFAKKPIRKEAIKKETSRKVKPIDPGAILVTVNSHRLREADLEVLYLSRKIPTEKRAFYRKQFLNEIIENYLLEKYLKNRKVSVNKRLLTRQLDYVRYLAAKNKKTLNELLLPMGLSEARLRKAFWLPLAWEAYAKRVITENQIQTHFNSFRSHYDGTRIEARQIFIPLKPSAPASEFKAIEKNLNDVRKQILSKSLTFEEAALKYSKSPSSKKGGKMGSFLYTGRMPSEISRIVFALDLNEVSPPLRTSFGMHIIQPTKKIAGQFSQEDARPAVFKALSQELRKSTLSKLHKTAKVEFAATEDKK